MINTEFLLANFFSTKQDILEFLEVFEKSIFTEVEKFEEAIIKNEMNNIEFFAHKLKAAFASLGIKDIETAFILIHKEAKNEQNLENIKIAYNSIKNQVYLLKIEIQKYKSEK